MEKYKARNTTTYRSFGREQTVRSKLITIVDKIMISSRKRTIFLIYFTIITALFIYEFLSYLNFDPTKIRIESTLDGNRVFRFGKPTFHYSSFYKLYGSGLALVFLSILPNLIMKINFDLDISNETISGLLEVLSMTLILILIQTVQGDTFVYIFCVIIITYEVINSKNPLRRRPVLVFFFIMLFILMGTVTTDIILNKILYLSKKFHWTINTNECEKIKDYLERLSIDGSQIFKFIKETGFNIDDVYIGKSISLMSRNCSFYIPGIAKYILVSFIVFQQIQNKLDDTVTLLFENPTSLSKCDVDMFKGVFLHELGHILRFHSFIKHIVLKFAFLIVVVMCGKRSFKNGNFKRIVHGLVIISVVCELNKIAMNALNHIFEYQADNYIKYKSPEFINATMYKLIKCMPEDDERILFYPRFSIFSTHPSLFHRIQNLGIKIKDDLIKLE